MEVFRNVKFVVVVLMHITLMFFQAGIILDDEKRLNVAISRARKKLILIGSKISLSEYKPFKNLINCLREDQFLNVT